jgi:hypothetical protein
MPVKRTQQQLAATIAASTRLSMVKRHIMPFVIAVCITIVTQYASFVTLARAADPTVVQIEHK